MKALAWFGLKDVRMVTAPIPDITEPDDVILQVTGMTICGSDLHPLQNYMYGQRDAGFFGYSHFTGGLPGGHSEYVRVPIGNVNLLPIPDSVPDEKANNLSDVLPTSYHTVVNTGVRPGDVDGIWVGISIQLLLYHFLRSSGLAPLYSSHAVPSDTLCDSSFSRVSGQ
ncbi:chaperonin 10-like protein [Lentinula novae-zelandiae]|nr:chaperonin 10-like protein [Lentinula novae-zelandiae]